MHKRILVPRIGTAFAGAMLLRLQMPAGRMNGRAQACLSAVSKWVDIKGRKLPFVLRNSVTDSLLAVADAIQSI